MTRLRASGILDRSLDTAVALRDAIVEIDQLCGHDSDFDQGDLIQELMSRAQPDNGWFQYYHQVIAPARTWFQGNMFGYEIVRVGEQLEMLDRILASILANDLAGLRTVWIWSRFDREEIVDQQTTICHNVAIRVAFYANDPQVFAFVADRIQLQRSPMIHDFLRLAIQQSRLEIVTAILRLDGFALASFSPRGCQIMFALAVALCQKITDLEHPAYQVLKSVTEFLFPVQDGEFRLERDLSKEEAILIFRKVFAMDGMAHVIQWFRSQPIRSLLKEEGIV